MCVIYIAVILITLQVYMRGLYIIIFMLFFSIFTNFTRFLKDLLHEPIKEKLLVFDKNASLMIILILKINLFGKIYDPGWQEDGNSCFGKEEL